MKTVQGISNLPQTLMLDMKCSGLEYPSRLCAAMRHIPRSGDRICGYCCGTMNKDVVAIRPAIDTNVDNEKSLLRSVHVVQLVGRSDRLGLHLCSFDDHSTAFDTLCSTWIYLQRSIIL